MYKNTESRLLEEVNDSATPIIWFISTNRNQVDQATFDLYMRAAKSTQIAGEPLDLTIVRNVLLNKYKVVIYLRQKGMKPIFAPHIYYALQVSGWLK
jgi:hypothetical protein